MNSDTSDLEEVPTAFPKRALMNGWTISKKVDKPSRISAQTALARVRTGDAAKTFKQSGDDKAS